MPLPPLLAARALGRQLRRNQAPAAPPEARAEAARWLYSFGAPCITACPSGIDVPAFIKKIARNNPVGAARTTLTAIAAL